MFEYECSCNPSRKFRTNKEANYCPFCKGKCFKLVGKSSPKNWNTLYLCSTCGTDVWSAALKKVKYCSSCGGDVQKSSDLTAPTTGLINDIMFSSDEIAPLKIYCNCESPSFVNNDGIIVCKICSKERHPAMMTYIPFEIRSKIEKFEVVKLGKGKTLVEMFNPYGIATNGKEYINFINTNTHYIPNFNQILLPTHEQFSWLVPYTGNAHNKTLFTHIVISSVARTLYEASGLKCPALIECFVGSGQIFLNSLYNSYYFNKCQIFSKFVGGDLNHYIIAAYNGMKSLKKVFVEKYLEFSLEKDESIKKSFQEILELLEIKGKALAVSKEIKESAFASFCYIYILNRCLRSTSISSSGGLNAKFNDKLNLSAIQEREARTLTFVTEQINEIDTNFFCLDFRETCGSARSGDIVVMDCPFPKFSMSTSEIFSSSVSNYGLGEEGEGLQNRICQCAKYLADRNITVILCNFANPHLIKSYQKIGATTFFTYKSPSRDSELYQLAILPGKDIKSYDFASLILKIWEDFQ